MKLLILSILMAALAFAENLGKTVTYKEIETQIPLKKNISAVTKATDVKWNALIENIARNGKVINIDHLSYLYLENIVFKENAKDYSANYISLVGFISEGVFNASHLEVVSENWLINSEGNWNIDQWLYKVSGNSELKWAAHFDMIQTQERQVLKHEHVPETEEILKSHWDDNLASWYHFIGQP